MATKVIQAKALEFTSDDTGEINGYLRRATVEDDNPVTHPLVQIDIVEGQDGVRTLVTTELSRDTIKAMARYMNDYLAETDEEGDV
jgi:hypothetical protein